MKILFIFVDGLGLGENDPGLNPLARNSLSHIGCYEKGQRVNPIAGNGFLVSLDANLGIEGLPQSATGQTSLLTGVNAAALLGKHLPAYPNEFLRNILREKSILKQIRSLGLRPAFINAYRPLFFRLKPRTQWRLSTTTVATLAAELPFFRIEDILRGRSIYHDFTNQSLVDRGFSLPLFSPADAAGILAGALREYDFILYEYFLTDHAGHSQDMARAQREVDKLDSLIRTLVGTLDPEDTLLLFTSDHGNVEDLSVKTHTRNPVPAMLWGSFAEELAERIRSIEDVTPALIDRLK